MYKVARGRVSDFASIVGTPDRGDGSTNRYLGPGHDEHQQKLRR